ncbi:hypothetical protein SDC9_90144 [bioreactor metagenome]|uniref:Uncharacterized protein n=1 Tax=bioreactor metagenome TaxID=1076179 RepID=A0A644ZR73_9ZZZZ
MLQRRQAPREHGLRERADQVTTPGRDRGGPLLIRQATGPVAFIERVQASVEAVAKHDGAPADGVGDGGVFALRVSGHVHAPPERQRPSVERLGQRGLAGADDPGQHHVGCGDDPARVEHPRVVDETPARVEVLADEHAIGAEPSFGDERVRARQRRRRVLMPRQMEPARRAQPRSPRLARLRQVDGGAALGTILLGLRLRSGDRGPSLLGVQPGLGLAALLAELPPLLRRCHQNGGVQPRAILGHSTSPRACLTAVILAGSNHDPSRFGAGRSARLGAPGDEYDTSSSGALCTGEGSTCSAS